MASDEDRIEEDGFVWEGSRASLEAWKAYKKHKALAFVQRGYSVSWYPDTDGWMDVFTPERHHAGVPEHRAAVKFFSEPSSYGIDGGKISKLTISSRRSNLIAKVLRGVFDDVALLFNYDRGHDVDRLASDPRARRLYDDVVEELN